MSSWLLTFNARRAQSKAIGKALSISVLNQVVSSGTNFAFGIYLVRVLTPTEFGLYGIGFAISLFYAGIGNALFLTQMVVHVPDKAPEDRLPYAARMLTAVMLFCLATIVVAFMVLWIGGSWSDWMAQYSGLGAAITGASVAYLLKEFFVRHAYTARKETWAFVASIAVAVTLVAILLLQHYALVEFTPVQALWLYAEGQFAGAVVGFAQAQLPLNAVRRGRLLGDLLEAWKGGRWATGGVSVTWAQSQSYTYVVALFVGPAGVGYANAARLLIAPVAFLFPAIDQVVMPRLASMRASNLPGMLKTGRLVAAGLLIVVVAYSAILLSQVDIIAPIVLGSHYDQIAPLVAVWCLILFLQVARNGASTMLQAMKRFRSLMLTNAVSAAVAVGAAVVLMRIMGIPGAILGTAAGELILAVLLWRLLANERTSFH